MLKPNFWKDVVPQDFVNDVKRYIDSEVELVRAHAGYSKSGEKRFRDCSNTGKIKIWNFHEESNEIERTISNIMYKLAVKANNHFRFDLDHNFMILHKGDGRKIMGTGRDK